MAPRLDLSPGDDLLPPLGPCCRQGGEEQKAAPQNRATALPNTSKVPFGWDASAARTVSACCSVV